MANKIYPSNDAEFAVWLANFINKETTFRTDYKHENQTPGVKAQYRVRAKRGDFGSGFSNTAVVYG